MKSILFVAVVFVCFCSAFAAGGIGSTKFYEDHYVDQLFEGATKKYGTFSANTKYVCTNPPNCVLAYYREEFKPCLSLTRHIYADSNTGKVVKHGLQYTGKCNMYDDAPKVKEMFGNGFPKPKFISKNNDRTASALWFDGELTLSVYAFCGSNGDYGPRGPTVDKFIECHVIEYTILKKLESAYENRFKNNNFKFD